MAERAGFDEGSDFNADQFEVAPIVIFRHNPSNDNINNDVNEDTGAFIAAPMAAGKGDWFESAQKARDVISTMDNASKQMFTSGISAPNGCHGFIPRVDVSPNFTFPGLCLADSANGLRATDFVTSFPSGIHTGASWNRNLARARATAIGAEFAKKGVNVLLGPVVGPLGRLPKGGRNWEGFSNDPYLAGALAYQTVQGIQEQGVIASTKHFIANEQETNRLSSNGTEAVSSNVDDRALHELYAWPFQDALKAGTGSIMCSYQRINNSYGCDNSLTINGLLKTELGFEGFVVSDWNATNSGAATARSGLDMAMPEGEHFGFSMLQQAVHNTSIAEVRLDDMVQRILTPWFKINSLQDFSQPGHGMPKYFGGSYEPVDARDPTAAHTLFNSAVEGHVLVKNNNTLPLSRLQPKAISIFGYSATAPMSLSPGMDPMDLFRWQFGTQSTSAEEVYAGFTGMVYNFSTIATNATMIHGGGSGATTPSSFTAPFDALRSRALLENATVFYDFVSARPEVRVDSDVCIVFGNAWASESYDRPALFDDYTDDLIKHVAGRCEKTIAIFHNAGVRLVDNFVEHENVTAIIFAHLPGEQTGLALTSLLYGDENFSGKLPYTVPKKETDYGHLLYPDVSRFEPDNSPQSDFTEGLYIDYRHFDREDVQARYDFGFGLSYTTFELSNFTSFAASNTTISFGEWAIGEIVQGGRKDLWDVLLYIYATVENTGSVGGAEVAQLYLSIPNSPPKQLRGFSKTSYLEPGESTEVEFQLTRRDASIWNVAAQEWQLQQSVPFEVTVGTSRADSAWHVSLDFESFGEEPVSKDAVREAHPLALMLELIEGT